MEEEIDLRPYLFALLRRWWLILALMLVCALPLALYAGLRPRPPQSDATLLIIPSNSQVTLDSRFITRDDVVSTNQSFQRQALLGLAESSALEQRVAADLGITLKVIGELRNRITVTTEGDLITITAKGATDADALSLAEAWSRNYERLVLETYSRDTAQAAVTTEQVREAEVSLEEAQAELDQFIREGELVRVGQRLARVDDLVESMRQADVLRYTETLTRTREIEQLLFDARLLQDQVVSGSSDQLADSVASILLRSRMTGDRPNYLFVQVNPGDGNDREAILADLEVLVAVLERQHETLISEAERLGNVLVGDGSEAGNLSMEQRRAYEQEAAELQAAYSALQGRHDLLVQQRDVARSTLDVLQLKAEEQQIARSVSQATVRYLGAGIRPDAVGLVSVAVYGVAGAMIGFLIGVVIVLYQAFARSGNAARPQPVLQPGDRSGESP
jgi:capsular polysaccharide biosynthesis protein